MAGVKGRSGGKRYEKPSEEKRFSKSFSITRSSLTKLQHIAMAMFGTDKYTIAKALENTIDESYNRWVVNDVLPSTKQGSYPDFRNGFIHIYRPNLDNSQLPRNMYLSDAFISCLQRYSGDRKHRAVLVERILQKYEIDVQEIAEYFLRKNIYFEKKEIVQYALKYFAGSSGSI